jgi:hypothetical protein
MQQEKRAKMQTEPELITWLMRCPVCGKQLEAVLRAGDQILIPNHIAPGFGHPCRGALGFPQGVWRKGGDSEDDPVDSSSEAP